MITQEFISQKIDIEQLEKALRQVKISQCGQKKLSLYARLRKHLADWNKLCYSVIISTSFPQEALLDILHRVKQLKKEGCLVEVKYLLSDTKICQFDCCNDCQALREYQEEYKRKLGFVLDILCESVCD